MSDKTSETIPAPPAFAVGDRVRYVDTCDGTRSMVVEAVRGEFLDVSWHITGRPRGTATVQTSQVRKAAKRGFAAMSAETQKAIASVGGKQAHAKGTAHQFDPDEAREAGRKGGAAAQRARGSAGMGSTGAG